MMEYAEQLNPFEPPTKSAELSSERRKSKGLRPATRVQRLIHLVVDQVAATLVSTCMATVVALVMPSFASSESPAVAMAELVIAVGSFFACYWLPETMWGLTLGKLLTGTRVVDEEGRTPNGSQIALRTVLRWVPLEALTFLRRNGLHDRASRTRVVQVRGRRT